MLLYLCQRNKQPQGADREDEMREFTVAELGTMIGCVEESTLHSEISENVDHDGVLKAIGFL